MSKRFYKSILSRMNIKEMNEEIILLEDYEQIDINFIREISNIRNNLYDMISILKIGVLHEEIFSKKKRLCSVIELKRNFEFIKILNEENNKIYEINFLILKNRNYTVDDILKKINTLIIFGNDIKEYLNLDKFPIDYNEYILFEQNFNECNEYKKYNFYDKVYKLIKYDKIFEKLENSIKICCNDLEKKMEQKFNENDEKLNSFFELLKKDYESLISNENK